MSYNLNDTEKRTKPPSWLDITSLYRTQPKTRPALNIRRADLVVKFDDLSKDLEIIYLDMGKKKINEEFWQRMAGFFVEQTGVLMGNAISAGVAGTPSLERDERIKLLKITPYFLELKNALKKLQHASLASEMRDTVDSALAKTEHVIDSFGITQVDGTVHINRNSDLGEFTLKRFAENGFPLIR